MGAWKNLVEFVVIFKQFYKHRKLERELSENAHKIIAKQVLEDIAISRKRDEEESKQFAEALSNMATMISTMKSEMREDNMRMKEKIKGLIDQNMKVIQQFHSKEEEDKHAQLRQFINQSSPDDNTLKYTREDLEKMAKQNVDVDVKEVLGALLKPQQQQTTSQQASSSNQQPQQQQQKASAQQQQQQQGHQAFTSAAYRHVQFGRPQKSATKAELMERIKQLQEDAEPMIKSNNSNKQQQ